MNPAESIDWTIALPLALALWALYVWIVHHDHAQRVSREDLHRRRARLAMLTKSGQHSRLDDQPQQAELHSRCNQYAENDQEPCVTAHARSVAR